MLIRFYNLEVDRPQPQVNQEIRALLTDDTLVLGLCETIGYILPEVPGYILIRDRSRPGRANIAAYVLNGMALRKIRWHDCHITWSRTQHPGTHPPRSILEFRIGGGVQVLVAHQPPKFTDNVIPSQAEGIKVMTRRMAPWTGVWFRRLVGKVRLIEKARPRLVIMDANRGPNEDGPGPKKLAQSIGGKVVGTRIDLAVLRNCQSEGLHYFEQVDGVKLESDHRHAFQFLLSVPDRWKPK